MSDLAAAKRSFDAAIQCIFGTEAVHMSLLFFLTYVSAAGSLDALLSSRKNFGGQEFKVVVRFLATLVYNIVCSFVIISWHTKPFSAVTLSSQSGNWRHYHCFFRFVLFLDLEGSLICTKVVVIIVVVIVVIVIEMPKSLICNQS